MLSGTLSEIIANSKLNLLKSVLTHQEIDIHDDIKNQIIHAKSAGEIWQLLFKNDLQDLYWKLELYGIIPTRSELNQINNADDTVSWMYLCRDIHKVIFQTLLDHGVYPDQKALSCRTFDNTNIWFCLAGTDTGRAIIQTLMQQGIYPQTKDLSACCTTDNTNGWHWLAGTDTGKAIFQALMQQGIYPDPKDLSACCTTDNTNAWFWLAANEKGRAIIQALMQQGIYPQSSDLSACYITDNTNGWFRLAGTETGRAIIQALIQQGIYPQSRDLSACRTTDNTNGWFWLAGGGETGRTIFQALIQQGIYPQSRDLSACRTTDNTNGWYWLSCSNEGKDLFAELLSMDIYPFMDDLLIRNTTDHSNAWEKLSRGGNMIRARLEQVKAAARYYNIKECQVTRVLSRDDKLDYYGFLYLYYSMTSKSLDLPDELWSLIAKHLSLSITLNFQALRADENRQSFLKYHMIESLNKYSSGFFMPHGDRATSLKDAVKNSEDTRGLLINQCYMSRRKTSPYKIAPPLKYQEPYSKSVTETAFYEILQDGFFLSGGNIKKKAEMKQEKELKSYGFKLI